MKEAKHVRIYYYYRGGYTGVISAALLSKLTNSSNEPLYDITLLEEKENILDGASKIIDRLHLGGEYPLDEKTALECLKGAILFKQMMPDVYSETPATNYVVSENTQHSGILTVEKVILQYKKIQKKYEKYFKQFAAVYGKMHAAKMLFGLPEELFCILTDIPHINGFAGGIKTKEKGINPVFLGAFLEKFIQNQGVKIHKNHQVINSTPTEAGFKVVALSKGKEVAFQGSQVINASWHNAYGLNTLINSQIQKHKSINAYLRCNAIIDISDCTEKPEAIFGMLGKHGGSYSPMNDKIAFIYLPDEGGSYLESAQQDIHNPWVPENWGDIMKKGPKDQNDRKQVILGKLTKRYPFLNGAKVLKLCVRPTLSEDSILEKRRHIAVTPIDSTGCWLSAISTKATFAPLVAIEVLKYVQQNSLRKGSIQKQDLVLTERKIPVILPAQLILSNNFFHSSQFLEDLAKFAKKRHFPSEIVTRRKQTPEHYADFNHLEYTDPLYFVLIHSGNKIEEGVSFKGTHVHAIKKSVVEREWGFFSMKDNIPANTIIQHGTINDLVMGKFNTNITEYDRLTKIGGNAGIASRASLIQGHWTLNDEAIIIEKAGFYGDYKGNAARLEQTHVYSFLQVFGLKKAKNLLLSNAVNLTDLTEFIQSMIPQADSFAACFSGIMLKGESISRVIKGANFPNDVPYKNLKEVWDKRKEFSGRRPPELLHLVNFKDSKRKKLPSIILTSAIQAIPINQFLISDNRGKVILPSGNYRRILLANEVQN